MGSLPAATGLVLLYVLFSILQPTFGGLFNLGNMLTEGAGPIFIAMGLVFVLLLGEIDLSAGFAAGVCACVMVRLMVGYHAPWPVSIGAAIITGVIIGSADRGVAGQGPHPVVRGDAGVLPGVSGCGAVHRRER